MAKIERAKAGKVEDKTTREAKQEELSEITRRELRLRERLLNVDEDLVRDEVRLKRNSERRRDKLVQKINRERERRQFRLYLHDKSKLYGRCKPLYYLASPFFAVGRSAKRLYNKLSGKVDHHRTVTPHRSFYLTTHAQAVRQINATGYFRFVGEVWRFIWDNRKVYIKALLLLTLVLLSVIGLAAQDSYIEMRDALQEVGLGWFLETVGLVTQAVITCLNIGDSNKQTFAIVLVMIAWLTLVYIARHLYGGKKSIKLRDALYNASGPFIPLMLLLLMILVQLLPLALVMISYSAVSGAGYINEGIEIENMAAWCAIAVVAVLTLYWMVTCLLCLITITVPGIYPMQAYYETSKLVSGRRVKILCRVLMMLVAIIPVWFVILVPVVAIDEVVKFTNVPLVQLATTLLVAATVVWMSAYLYMLYRRILDSPEQPIGTRNTKFVWPWLRKKRKAAIESAQSPNKTKVEPKQARN